ncbi:Kinesin-like protein KIN-7G [Camellia lanceoleosa]|uniref:Kinesin-like protein KIN-7G n=1 Tax=Camellia lanceoleosa TaxID=1840588 RepID=A0ACC0I465_9ERIC|nr:Kinesin-like protein KIN-7G [Camellia lanceoleosa]
MLWSQFEDEQVSVCSFFGKIFHSLILFSPTYCDCICILFGDGFLVRTELVCGGGGGKRTTGGGCEEKIFVSVRLTPLNEKEIARNDVCDWECINEDTIIFKNCNLPLPDRSIMLDLRKKFECNLRRIVVTISYQHCCHGLDTPHQHPTPPPPRQVDRVFRSDCSTTEVYEKGAKGVALSVVNSISQRGTVTEKLTEEPLRDWNNVMELLSICEDKALVKHLQRELARLESELRSQGPTFVASHYLALLREKGLQIEKLEKEMIDLTIQRDLAQCQVQDLLQLVGNEGHSMTRVLITTHACKFESHRNLKIQYQRHPLWQVLTPWTLVLDQSRDLFILMDIVGEALMITAYKFFLNLKRTLCRMILLHSYWSVFLCLSEAILDGVGTWDFGGFMQGSLMHRGRRIE